MIQEAERERSMRSCWLAIIMALKKKKKKPQNVLGHTGGPKKSQLVSIKQQR